MLAFHEGIWQEKSLLQENDQSKTTLSHRQDELFVPSMTFQ